MKQFLFISLFIGLAINAYSHHTPTTEQKELEGEVIYSKTSVPKMKRTPIIADILMIISDESISISLKGDYGCGTFHLYDSSAEAYICGEINSSIEHNLIICYSVMSSSAIDFSIEFEDGSWCHLTWEGLCVNKE